MPIEYVYKTDFALKNESSVSSWIKDVIISDTDSFKENKIIYKVFNKVL